MSWKINFSSAILIALIFCGVIFQNVALFKSGQIHEYKEGKIGIGYWGPLARDGVWHEALVSQLAHKFPPENPGLSGVKLTNYHYYYDLLVSITSKTFGVSPAFLIYRFYPLIFSILLGIGVYLLSFKLFKSKSVSSVAVFLAYFGSSFGWIVDILKGKTEIGGESAFWANQPVSMNLNPPFAISLILMIGILLLLDNYLSTNKKRFALGVVTLSGILVGFKIYAGIIVLGGLFLLAIKKYLSENDSKVGGIFILSSGLAALLYLPQADFSQSLINFSPLWLINTMIDAGDRVGIPNFTARRFAYEGGGKWIHLAGLQLICIFLFVAGNLGTRIIAVFGVKKNYLRSDLHVFILFMMLVSFIPPLIFIQKGNPWNIVQFLYYFLFFASLWASFGVISVFNRLQRVAANLFLILFIIITPISSISTFRSWLYPNPPAYLPKKESEALEFLKGQKDGIVLKHPFDSSSRQNFKDPYPLAVYADNAYVAAFTGKPVYLEDVEQQIVLASDYKPRLEEIRRFFIEKDLKWSDNFLNENDISYVYLPKIYFLPQAEKMYKMEKIFENEEVNIYKVAR